MCSAFCYSSQRQAVLTASVIGQPDATAQAELTTTAGATLGVALSPMTVSGSGEPGSTVTYTLMLTNTSNANLSFEISSASAWQVELSNAQLDLGAGESAALTVGVHIPTGATDGDLDTAVITAAAPGQAGITAQSEITTTAVVPAGFIRRLFLPITVKGTGN